MNKRQWGGFEDLEYDRAGETGARTGPDKH